MSKQQRLILVSIVLFLLGGLVLAVYLARQIAKPTPRAEENRVVFTLQTTNPIPDTGDEMTVSLFARAPVNTAIRTLSAYINYDPNLLEVVPALAETEDNDGVYRSNEDPFVDWSYIKTKNNTTDSRIEILASYRPLEAVSPDNPKLLNYDDGAPLFATVQFRWKGGPADSTTLQLITDPATSGAKDPDGNDVPVAPSSLLIPVPLTSPPPPTISISPPPVGEGAFHLDPSSGQYSPDQTFATKILLDTGGEDVKSVDAFLSFDPRIVEVEAVEEGTIAEFTQFQQNVDQANGKVYVGASIDNPNVDNPATVVNGDGLHLATITWNTLASITLPGGETAPVPPLVTTAITFDCTPGSTNDSNITKADRNATDILNCAKITNGTYTIQFPAFSDQPSLYLSPSRGRASAGEMFTSTIFLNTGGNDVSGVDAAVSFDPQILNVVSTAKGDIPEFIAYFENIDNEKGKVTLSAIISPDVTEIQQAAARPTPRPNQRPVNGQGLKFGTITFKVLPIIGGETNSPPDLGELETSINFDFTPGEKNDSNIAEYHEGGDILAATYGSIYTISYRPIAGPRLKLRLELCDEPSQRKVYLTLPDDSLVETTLSGKNDEHIHTTDPVNIPAGTQSLAVRVAGYLAHTFRLPTSWTNLIDLSSFTLLGGDIDGSGKVNVLDFNLFKSDYLTHEETPADLDCSDQVNSLDYDGIIRNWNKTSD